MLQERYDKLIELIRNSSILSPRERAEWTALLELMNDKQINELEKILSVAEDQDRAVAPVRPQPPKPVFKPAPLTPESLLRNLQPPAKLGRPLEDIKRNQTFTRLKDILEEKELSPGHPEPVKELELPPPKSITAQSEQPVLPRPAPPVARPVPPVPPAKPKAGADLSSLLAKKLAGQESIMRGPVLPKAPIRQTVSSQVQGEGLNLGVELGKVRGLEQAGKVFEPARRPQVSHREHLYEKPSITSLQGLSQLTYNNFSAAHADELFEFIKALIKQYGFHDTRVYLEQSPLYQTYLETGAKVLAGQADFIQDWEGLMNQADFEKFADLLIQMHTV